MTWNDTIAADIDIVLAPVHVDKTYRTLVAWIVPPLIFLPAIIRVILEYNKKLVGKSSEIEDVEN
jgi:hypothetical protein